MKNKIKDRHLDLSAKLIEMGNALITEGKEKKDYSISQIGFFMVFIGGLLLNEEDIYLFGELCSMFSAKKIIDTLAYKSLNISDLLNGSSIDETYDEFIKRINKLRDKDNDIDSDKLSE